LRPPAGGPRSVAAAKVSMSHVSDRLNVSLSQSLRKSQVSGLRSPSSTHPPAKLQFPKIPLALSGGMWHTIFVLPLKGEMATNDFRITSFPMKADGTPDFGGMTVDPPPIQWNVPATWKVKGSVTLEGPWGGCAIRRESGIQVLQGGGGATVAVARERDPPVREWRRWGMRAQQVAPLPCNGRDARCPSAARPEAAPA